MTDSNLSQSHEPQLLRELRQKTIAVQSSIQTLSAQIRKDEQHRQTLSRQHTKLKQQIEVQQKKYRSLIVLLNQLQQTYHSQFLQQRQEIDVDEVGLSSENSLLRFLLIRQTQNLKQSEKVKNLLKYLQLDKNKTKPKQYIKKSNFIESQSELIAKLKSQLYQYHNENLECKRKWYALQEQSKNLQSQNKLLSIQNERQKIQIKSMYEEYLERINEAKMKVVSFNQTQKQATINEHFVKQIAILQQKRVEIEQENSNLQYHYQNLKEELERIEIENKELLGFFQEAGQEGALAQKMKKRIQELRDVVIECKKKNRNTRGAKLRKILENIKAYHKILVESNDYVEMKTREQQNFGSFLQQKPIADFFTKILQQKDKALLIMQEEQSNLRQKLKQLQIQKQLLMNQITNLQDNLDMDSWETKFAQTKNWSNYSSHYQRQNSKSEINQKQSQPRKTPKNQDTDYGYLGSYTFDRRNK